MFGLLHSTSFVYWKALSNLARNRCLLSRSCDLLSAASCSNMKPSTPTVKAVIFDLGGVILEQPQRGLRRYAESLGFPGMLIHNWKFPQPMFGNGISRNDSMPNSAAYFKNTFIKMAVTFQNVHQNKNLG
ncbi:uncharacterized protein LOC117113039 [Anneissia japonica]|uniref:uncharacterized protein LOC117113039 n=1 Tax=Anneissia japonica TaxID=1529436 RepID=UPI00142589BA|nr:uncharacterized protein LOC117113039 [Anneissia japonica]